MIIRYICVLQGRWLVVGQEFQYRKDRLRAKHLCSTRERHRALRVSWHLFISPSIWSQEARGRLLGDQRRGFRENNFYDEIKIQFSLLLKIDEVLFLRKCPVLLCCWHLILKSHAWFLCCFAIVVFICRKDLLVATL